MRPTLIESAKIFLPSLFKHFSTSHWEQDKVSTQTCKYSTTLRNQAKQTKDEICDWNWFSCLTHRIPNCLMFSWLIDDSVEAKSGQNTSRVWLRAWWRFIVLSHNIWQDVATRLDLAVTVLNGKRKVETSFIIRFAFFIALKSLEVLINARFELFAVSYALWNWVLINLASHFAYQQKALRRHLINQNCAASYLAFMLAFQCECQRVVATWKVDENPAKEIM